MKTVALSIAFLLFLLGCSQQEGSVFRTGIVVRKDHQPEKYWVQDGNLFTVTVVGKASFTTNNRMLLLHHQCESWMLVLQDATSNNKERIVYVPQSTYDATPIGSAYRFDYWYDRNEPTVDRQAATAEDISSYGVQKQ
ncbi:MAG: hypothetical protein ACD_81C00101G0001 [uncultured bacterium]|uniref:Lipoprotein n=2 Tax=Candidatus Wolfeibacteriota TaxID=1752735 RepID=A0A0G1H6H2_9BACT|nr:MAG: hypothetical protein ACD_81C00101G0001 [uncultured bacterium]KKR12162.1 MAG: hypothetical protein UT41_C0003G0089 [Candidatus Wolfebacteria bacterium GW2011_GWC2_39_22]KKT42991.1 MAG: hypothetical protein UW32_C0003G0094 [Candidatus Wolfebacteria bacterium GW2011_GWE2_44_13]HBI25218.1 hypothetical protein [Candidatus Wolfebacteria bacterium]